MTENQDSINKLHQKLEKLLVQQQAFSREVDQLREELNLLKDSEKVGIERKENIKQDKLEADTDIEIKSETVTAKNQTSPQETTNEPAKYSTSKINKPPTIKSDLEKFIGENLINKIGIAITIIGVGIGVKYAIDHQLISPLVRIILGYAFALGLLGFAIPLKKKYGDFSAVLLSGSMAIMYFITYSAYSFYELVPLVFTFVLMAIFTIFTVVAAINYNRQVIAHIGLVGAYAVPFLLSDGTGNVAILFGYMAIINVGILVVAFKKYWKSLYYSSFVLTWLIYLQWYGSSYHPAEHFNLALTYLSIFFATFYFIFLAYKLIQKEKFEIDDIVLLLANSFIFYGLGYAILNNHESGNQLLGLFTLGNALVHFMVSAVIYWQKLADRNLFYLISGLVLVFISIAIPVQLDGNWVTLLWAGEAALLFWVGRTKHASIYEILSYPLMVLALFSIVHDWTTVYNIYDPSFPETGITPLLNINFLTSFLLVAAFGFINIVNSNKNYPSPVLNQKDLLIIVSFTIPAFLLFAIYYAFRMEIAVYWNQLYADSAITINGQNQQTPNYWNYDLRNFKTIWILNYTLLFFTVLSFINLNKLRNRQLGLINLALNALTIETFLILGLYALSELRESYLEQTLSDYFHGGIFNIGIRYISFAFIAILLIACHRYIRQEFMKWNFKIAFDFLLHTTILWIASSELINLLDIAESTQSYKLGLSILWGVYALLLIVLGIWKKKKHLRLGAMALFAITLIKLFFYDLSQLDTISKTILFISLGILLLIISFLYNKYKHIISEEIKS